MQNSGYLRQTPNALTALRACIALIIAHFTYLEYHHGDVPHAAHMFFVERLVAISLYVVACITEYYDGHLARAYGWETAFGRNFDPFADKLLAVCVLGYTLAAYNAGALVWVYVPIASIILTYGVITTVMRILGAIENPNVKAKAKTAYLMIAMAFFLLTICFDQHAPDVAFAFYCAGLAFMTYAARLCWPALRAYWTPRQMQPAE